MNAIDEQVVLDCLDNALLHSDRNEWAEGYWIGRAVEHAHQNAIDYDWMVEQFKARGFDVAIIAVPKGDHSDPRDN